MAISIKEQLKKILTPFAKAVGQDIQRLDNKKQDKLKAGANITIAEDGTITAAAPGQTDLSAYSTTEQVETLVNGKIAGFVTDAAVDTKLADYAKTADVLTEAAVDTKLAAYTNTADLTTKLADYLKTADAVTEATVDGKLAAYTNTADLDTKLADYTKAADLTTTLAGYAQTAAVEAKQDKLTAGDNITIEADGTIKATVPEVDLTGYVKDTDLDLDDLDLAAIYESAKTETATEGGNTEEVGG